MSNMIFVLLLFTMFLAKVKSQTENETFYNSTESVLNEGKKHELMLFDFSSEGTIGWIEQSDTVRSVGKSKASLVPFQNKYDKWAVLFTMLNPQENGAGFAGYRIKTDLDLSDYSAFALKVRGQGKNSHYKLVLRHRGQNDEPFPSYEQTFKAPMNDFGEVIVDFNAFKPYYRGRPLNNVDPLDITKITSLGIQMFGGVYMKHQQKGTSSLEIEWIKAYV